ncbi:uncharacterized protein [Palaemon carinicauda]|uniref:uncharacterized protein n=1 Tax=Palaemon carinicauda TaxID=392227 RepID=UPI0035B6776A
MFCHCHRIGHFYKCCKDNKKKGHRDRFSSNSGACAVSNKHQDSRTSCHRLGSPPTISKMPKPIRFLLSSGNINSCIKMLPDTGANGTVIGQQHLDTMGISRSCLQPPPPNVTFTADGSPMSPDLGILQATLTLGKRSCLARIQVHENVEVPLLSYGHCQELSLISPDFPKPILEVKYVNRCKDLPISATTSPSAAKEYFLWEFKDLLVSKEDLKTAPLMPMAGPPMRIHLKDGAVPFVIHTPRQIPFVFKDQDKGELDSMVAHGIIKPAGDDPSVWCHPLVIFAKNGTGVRITVDLTKLNSPVSRPAHPSPTPFTAIHSVDRKSHFFITADALYRYWQMEVAEGDRHLTTFITPYGSFIHCRGPIGFAATRDAFCLRGDKALQGVQNCVKVIDNLLLYDEDYVTHLYCIHEGLTRCRKFGITLNKDKFVVFCGYTLSGDGISADHQKVSAIKDFPTPANLMDLRSFKGLVNQLAEFTPDISIAAQPSRCRSLIRMARCCPCKSDTTASNTIRIFCRYFHEVGVPLRFRTD